MISSSALRNQGARYVIRCAREYCTELSLNQFRRMNGALYANWLDAHTNRLVDYFPPRAKNWASARKALNIFMRSVAYTVPLAEAYELQRVVPYLEVPLDKDVATAMRKEPEGAALPAWDRIKTLTIAQSRSYQSVATSIARRKRVHRADLDAFYWAA